MSDLLILVPDKATEFTLRGAIGRTDALGIRPVSFRVLVEPGRDSGVRRRGVQILAVLRRTFAHAVMILDYEGCGSDLAAEELEAELDADLAQLWGDDAKAIVVAPEMDVWMWGSEVHLRSILQWPEPRSLQSWLESKGFKFDAFGKPDRPKEALNALFRHAKKPRSSANYQRVAQHVSLTRCTDQPFLRLRARVQQWFPAAP